MAILGNPSYSELENGVSTWSVTRDSQRKKTRDYLYGWGFLWVSWVVVSTICFAFLFGYVKILQNEMKNVMISQRGIESIVQNELFHYMRSFDEHYLAKIQRLNETDSESINDTSEELDNYTFSGVKDLHKHNDTHNKTIFGPPSRRKRDVVPANNEHNLLQDGNADDEESTGSSRWPKVLPPMPYRQTYRDTSRNQERTTHFFSGEQTRRAMVAYRERMSRQTISVHYNGDTNDYNIDRHPHYKGNGHIRHLHKKYTDWTPAGWVLDMHMDDYFNLTDGDLTVGPGGLYLIYVQIYYLDGHDRNAYRVYLNDNILLQCTITIHNIDGRDNGNTCYTSSVVRLQPNDTIYIADVNDNRYSIFDVGRSFFGLVKLGEA